MRLSRLRLRNFRQHADTEIVFGPGLTGIIGPNGSGKTTILESIAWAIYGGAGARGKSDSIRFDRAPARSTVEVEMEFGLGPHEYRVVRGPRAAKLFKDSRLLADSLTSVTNQLVRLLGMTRSEFFNTYFTGQKELAVMASMGPTERGRFLSQLLGYERLRDAQALLRERRTAVRGELQGLEGALASEQEIRKAREAAEANLAAVREELKAAEAGRAAAAAAAGRSEPEWRRFEALRDQFLRIEGESRIAEAAVKTAQAEFQRIDREMIRALQARDELLEVERELAPLAALRSELDALELAAQKDAERRGWQAQAAELTDAIARLDEKVSGLSAQLGTIGSVAADLDRARNRLEAATKQVARVRTSWVRDRQDAETKRQALRDQYRDARDQRDLIQELGPEGTCPTCQRPLGTHFHEVLNVLERQLEEIQVNGSYFKQRAEQLAAEPAELIELERDRDRAETQVQEHTARLATLEAARQQHEAALVERRTAADRLADIRARLERTDVRYDSERHDEVRRAVRQLEPVSTSAAALRDRAGRAEELIREAEEAERVASAREETVAELTAQMTKLGYAEKAYAAARARYEAATRALGETEVLLAGVQGRFTAAKQHVALVKRRETEREAALARHAALRHERGLINELDRAIGDLRTDLNAQVGPELSEVASGFLHDLTDGRYTEVVLDEQYQITLLEEGLPKPVISGGEEDLSNLVLRLAISQLVAERAGQPLSLLVLDEIFGSLDDARRENVVNLLRRLSDRFAQVVLITHVESVRDGLDRVIRVSYDSRSGTAMVADDTESLDGGESVAA